MANIRASPKGRVNKICDQCGETYSVIFSRKNIARFCSRNCCSKWQTGEKHPKWKGKIECICLECGKKFEVYPSDIKQGKGKFCSIKCHGKALGGRIKRICKYCGKEFSVQTNVVIKKGHGIFCSNKCKFKWMGENLKGKNMDHARRGKKEKPTRPEKIFQEICQRNDIPFHYVGDGQLWIGKNKKMNPDFIEANGKKICIEIMGRYWHSPLLNKNLREDALQPYREKHYRKYNWIPVFIWDTDLIRKDAEQFVLNELKRKGVI